MEFFCFILLSWSWNTPNGIPLLFLSDNTLWLVIKVWIALHHLKLKDTSTNTTKCLIHSKFTAFLKPNSASQTCLFVCLLMVKKNCFQYNRILSIANNALLTWNNAFSCFFDVHRNSSYGNHPLSKRGLREQFHCSIYYKVVFPSFRGIQGNEARYRRSSNLMVRVVTSHRFFMSI
jgi:hypothetical protein